MRKYIIAKLVSHGTYTCPGEFWTGEKWLTSEEASRLFNSSADAKTHATNNNLGRVEIISYYPGGTL